MILERVLRAVVFGSAFGVVAVSAAPIDPYLYASIGSVNQSGGTFTFDSDQRTVTFLNAAGSAGPFTIGFGSTHFQVGSLPDVTVFTFDQLAITGGATVNLVGSRPIAILSRGDLTVTSPIVIAPGTLGGGVSGVSPGPGAGANGRDVNVSICSPGSFGGSGCFTETRSGVGASGGFGGRGNRGEIPEGPLVPGGAPYGNLLTGLQGGSAGGNVQNRSGSTGGHGGGAIEIGARGVLSLAGVGATFGSGANGGGMGSGGAIIVHAGAAGSSVGTLDASGNPGNNFSSSGGGRILSMLAGTSHVFGTPRSDLRADGFERGVITLGVDRLTLPQGTSVSSMNGSLPDPAAGLELLVRRDITVSSGGLYDWRGDGLGQLGTVQVDANGRFEVSGSSTVLVLDRIVGDGRMALNAGIARLGGSLVTGGQPSTIGELTFAGGVLDLGGAGLSVQRGAVRWDANGLRLNGGTLTVGAGASADPGTQIADHGEIRGRLWRSGPGGAIRAAGGNLTLGDAADFLGLAYDGQFYTGPNTITLNTRGFANLGALTVLEGGVLAAPNGMALSTGRVLTGFGRVDARTAGQIGSVIELSGELAIGDKRRVDGFVTDGVVNVGSHRLRLLDANVAVLGSLTSLGAGDKAGVLIADRGLLLQQGRNLEGVGEIHGDFVNQGNVYAGDALGRGELQFFGRVSGIGSFEGGVVFHGGYAPGNSPAITQIASAIFAPTNVLEIEIGGRQAGSQHDQVQIAGLATLGGSLQILLIDEFQPVLGDTFTVITWGSRSGEFADVVGTALGGGIYFDLRYGEHGLSLTVSAVPEPGAWALLLAGLAFTLGFARRRRARAVRAA